MKTQVRRMLRGAIHTQHCTLSSELLLGEGDGVGVNVTAGKKQCWVIYMIYMIKIEKPFSILNTY